MGNYLHTAWRHLSRDKGITAITIFGLALGLSVCIFITLFVTDEFAYDRYNEKADRIFRIASDLHINGGTINDMATAPPIAAALVRDFPGIENAVRIRDVRGDVEVHVGTRLFSQTGVVWADSTLFGIFTLPMINGDPRTALNTPNSIVLSETIAKKYFNSTDVVGRTLQLDQDTAVCKVTGVIKDVPAASHFHFQLIRSLIQNRQIWISLFASTYVLARPGIQTADIDRMLAREVERYVYPQVREMMHNTEADLKRNGDYFRYYAMPLTRIHLYSNLGHEWEPNGDIRYVLLFIVAAVLVLVVAGINFVNLTIARSMRRLRDLGIRKILGSDRRQLIAQFLTESLLMTTIAMAIAVLLVLIGLQLFNRLAGKTFSAAVFLSDWTIPAFILATGLASLLSGAYPALILSRVQPLKILRGQLSLGSRPGVLRTILLVFQFSVAMTLIIATGVIYSQLYFIQHRDIGYHRQQVVTIKDTYRLGEKAWTFADEARKLPGVVSATVSGDLPNQKVVFIGFFKDRSASVTSTALLGVWHVDPDYIPTLGMQLVAGRNFSAQLHTDSACALINETAARMLGYPQPLGKKIYRSTDSTSAHTVIGVVKDFNTGTLRNQVDPVIFLLGPDGVSVTFRLAPGDVAGTISAIRRRYETVANGYPFIYSFLDEDFNRQYASDRHTAGLFTVFSGMAIIIAALGIFGLVTTATEQRTKELGIRRVLGARVRHLALLLLKDYGLALSLATLIALPIGAWVMHDWLQGFAFRTQLHPWIFIASPLCAIIVALLIIAAKAARTARANLADTLRTE